MGVSMSSLDGSWDVTLHAPRADMQGTLNLVSAEPSGTMSTAGDQITGTATAAPVIKIPFDGTRS